MLTFYPGLIYKLTELWRFRLGLISQLDNLGRLHTSV
jgi:hypothetical protein